MHLNLQCWKHLSHTATLWSCKSPTLLRGRGRPNPPRNNLEVQFCVPGSLNAFRSRSSSQKSTTGVAVFLFSVGLCGAARLFAELFALSLVCERLGESERRWGLRQHHKKKKEEENPQMTGVTLHRCRWEISPLSIQKSICNAAEKLQVDLFSHSPLQG